MNANAFEKLSKVVEDLRSRLDNRTREHNNLKHCFEDLKSKFEESKKHCVIGDNNREQYPRNWCLRVYGVNVSQSDIDELGLDVACMMAVDNRVLRPVLEQASKKVLPEIPPWYDLLENAHFLGKAVKSKTTGSILPRPIIVRFSKRWHRNLFLKLKKKNMPSPTMAERVQGIEFFSASPDLTKLNYSVMKGLNMDNRVSKVWSLDGKLKYTLVGNTFVYTVECVLDSINNIITTGYKQQGRFKQGFFRPAFVRTDSSLNAPNPLFDPVGDTVEQHPVQGRAQPAEQVNVPPVADPLVHAKAPPAAQADDLPAVRADISASSLSTPITRRPSSSSELSLASRPPGRRPQHAQILLQGPSPAILALRNKFDSLNNQENDG